MLPCSVARPQYSSASHTDFFFLNITKLDAVTVDAIESKVSKLSLFFFFLSEVAVEQQCVPTEVFGGLAQEDD